MKGVIVLCLLIISLVPTVLAETLSDKDLAAIQQEVDDFFVDDTTIIMGSGLSVAEKTLFRAVFKQSGYDREITILSDKQGVTGDLVLLGGIKTNQLAALVADINVGNESSYGPLRFSYYLVDGRRVMVAKTIREEQNYQYTGISKSPLAKFLPLAMVPIVASLISVLLMLLLQFLMNTATGLGKTALSILAGKEWKKRFDEGEAKKHVKFHVVDLPLRELLTLVLVVLILTTAKTWSFSPTWWSIFIVILVTTAILTVIREGSRIYLARKRHIHVESVFWPAGALLTLLSAWLGSMFALPSYLHIRKDENKKWGEVSLRVAYVTMLVSLISYLLNFWWPNPYYQTLSVLAATVAFVGLVPIPPLAGKTIWQKSKVGWLVAFLISLPLYIGVVFLSAYL